MDHDYHNNVKFVDWESKAHYYGACKLNRPGQSHFTQAAYYQFLNARSAEDKGVYIAGSAISWTGGWIEGALQTGLNAAAAVVHSLDGEFTSQDYNPFTQLDADIYEYS
jgi:tryptophan 2-monooxygenase